MFAIFVFDETRRGKMVKRVNFDDLHYFQQFSVCHGAAEVHYRLEPVKFSLRFAFFYL